MYETMAAALADAIRQTRRKKKDLAEFAGITASTLTRWLGGEVLPAPDGWCRLLAVIQREGVDVAPLHAALDAEFASMRAAYSTPATGTDLPV